MPATPAADREIITERLINAPRDLVFSAWTDPEHVAKWWGPDGFTNTIHEMDVRPGGVWRFVMHGPDGTDYQNLIVFAEIVKPERIVYDHVSTPKFRNTVTFVEEGGKTRVTMRAVFEDKAAFEMAVKTFKAAEGGKQTLGRLANFVEGPGPAAPSATDQPFVITRRFSAPRALVFKAWSDPAHFSQWWGPAGSVVKVLRMDFRPGGVVLYSWAYPGQASEWARFVFGRIVPERSIEFVNSFTNEAGEPVRAGFSADWPMEVRYTVTFEEEGDGTIMTLRGGAVRPSEAERAMFASIAASMEEGFGATFAALEAHLAGRARGENAARRKIVLFMHASLDGFVAGPRGEMDWIHVDEEIFEYAGARIKEGDTALYGRVTWEMMEAYWPTAADQPNPSKHDVEHSRWYNRVNKVVLSRTMEGVSRPNTRFIGSNLAAEIQALKATPGKDILIFGSPGAAHSLMAEDLIDGYWIFVNPLLLGAGVRLFDELQAKQQLRLLESRPLASGVVCLHYERRRDSSIPGVGVAD
ncbi:MAG: SRPBCC domain-containing protein [Vicinamibacteria bacterium]|nr:SRPBCC domain-containing protein [Vicinamibacteria bacterium]